MEADSAMAYACPSCKVPQMIAALFSADGATVFPCPECHWGPRSSPLPPDLRVDFPCVRPGCHGSAHDRYRLRGDRLELHHGPCDACRTAGLTRGEGVRVAPALL